MTEEELRNVKKFSVYNQFGKIEFLENVDLTELNIDKIISIDNKAISLYQDYKPEEGNELNKPANIHLYNCYPNRDNNDDFSSDEIRSFVEILKGFCRNRNVCRNFKFLG